MGAPEASTRPSSPIPPALSPPPIHVGLLLAFYTLEAAGLSCAMVLNRYWDRLPPHTIRQNVFILAPLAALLASGVYISVCYLRAGRSGTRRLNLTLATNLLAVAGLLVAGETAVRVFSRLTPLGSSFAGTLLLPRSWDHVKARNAELLKHAPSNISYFVSDSLLGWAVGRSRRSADGLYLSSAEGLRSPRSGMAYADHPSSHRIAIVGDSYTFGLEVPFHESWGFQLERALGDEFAVLNFGVDGYGVDQAYLRYDRDVRPWRPTLTIFGFVQHDLYRSLSVYNFVTFPEWGFPFSKPRFTLKAGTLELLNAPVIGPSDIFAKQSVTDLPFIGYDAGYNPDAWRWHAYYSSRLLRFLVSRFPRWPPLDPEVGDEALRRINAELLLAFTRRAAAEGTVPLVVYLPSRNDFWTGQDLSSKDSVLAVLHRAGVHYLDLTSCIGELGPEKPFLPGRRHYSAEGNAAVARCLLPAVRHDLQR